MIHLDTLGEGRLRAPAIRVFELDRARNVETSTFEASQIFIKFQEMFRDRSAALF